MKLIIYISDKTIDSAHIPVKTSSIWNIREASRAVLVNNKNQIALMHIAEYGVYKLPGGGVDEGETIDQALIREMREETGCDVEKGDMIGITIEKRDEWKLIQISHCFIARVVAENELQLTDEELATGFSLQWINTIDEAMELVNRNTSDRYDDKYIKARDHAILQKAKEVINI